MATMNISLPDQMKQWVEQQVKTGEYSNASDYIRSLIRRDREYHDKRNVLVQALIEGEQSGVSNRTIDDIWEQALARHRVDL